VGKIVLNDVLSMSFSRMSSSISNLNMASTELPFSKKVKPSLVLGIQNGVGNFTQNQNNMGIKLQTLNEGYFESGIEPTKF
jgi:hypothetical protein